MRITIESTDMITEVGGVTCRVWRGATQFGVACDLAIPMIRVREELDRTQFEDELKELPAPEQARTVSMRQVW